MKPSLLITVKDHGDTVGEVVAGLAPLELPCIVIDDGSAGHTAEILDKLAAQTPWVRLERFDENRGRGAALRYGYRLAGELGYSHSLQIDADRQHDPADAIRLLDAARSEPEALILGEPVFDASAPASRMFGRQFSRVLVWLESLSFDIRDPLCGMRCMPLAPTLRVLAKTELGDRMEFEPEIAVRLLWAGTPVRNVPIAVRYFSDGLSNFDPWWDTLRIAGVHGRLVAGMIPRAPTLLARRYARSR